MGRLRGTPGVTALVVLSVAAVVTALGFALADRARTPVGGAGVGTGSHPVAEIAGLGSNGSNYARLTAALEERGTTVLDFDPDTPGVQALTYRPTAGTHVPALAEKTVAPAIRAALRRAGLPTDTTIDVVAHSTGGLLMRWLVEEDGWASRVDDLVMVAVPNHGSQVVYWETRGGNPMAALGEDMRPGSALLDRLGYAEPAGEVYTTIGGDPWFLRGIRFPGPGPLGGLVGQGFDDQVPSRSPFLAGAANNVYPHAHGRLLRSAEVVDLIDRTLAAR